MTLSSAEERIISVLGRKLPDHRELISITTLQLEDGDHSAITNLIRMKLIEELAHPMVRLTRLGTEFVQLAMVADPLPMSMNLLKPLGRTPPPQPPEPA